MNGLGLNKAENRLKFRYVPNNSTIIDDGYCIAYEYETVKGQIALVGYIGTSSKPAIHYSFKTIEDRRKRLNEWRASVAERQDRMKQRKQERQSFKHTLKVGDILTSSWGYDQTNIDFYQVKEVRGAFVIIQSIRQSREYDTQDTGTCIPVKDDFVTNAPELRKKVTGGNGYQYINLSSYSSASLWDGKPENWTAYA